MRNAISVIWIQATHVQASQKDTACLSTMTWCCERCDCSLQEVQQRCADCGLWMQICSNCWIRGLTVNRFFYSEVEVLRSQWI